jgi:hypothetical protein
LFIKRRKSLDDAIPACLKLSVFVDNACEAMFSVIVSNARNVPEIFKFFQDLVYALPLLLPYPPPDRFVNLIAYVGDLPLVFELRSSGSKFPAFSNQFTQRAI